MSGPRTIESVRGRAYVLAPLAFGAVGLALSAVSSARDGAGVAGVIGAAGALGLVYWLGRRSKVEATAVAVAQAVAAARAEASAEATAQALNQVAVIVGDRAEIVERGGVEESYAIAAHMDREREPAQDFLGAAPAVPHVAAAYERYAAEQFARGQVSPVIPGDDMR